MSNLQACSRDGRHSLRALLGSTIPWEPIHPQDFQTALED
jgi:hypothetical protein